jgi:S-formylglutathione hydrolase FrmB
MDALTEHIDNSFITIAPDGENSYWMNGALTNLRWGDVITTELINEVENKFSVYRSSEGRLIAGISMGGHGAIQLTLNNPGIYGAIAAHSPVFRTQEEASRDFYFEFGTGLDYLNRDPFSLMMSLGKTINVPIWIDMGGADPWLRNTQNFANYISSKKLPASLHVAEDALSGHDFDYWRFHLSSYLEWYSKQIKK